MWVKLDAKDNILSDRYIIINEAYAQITPDTIIFKVKNSRWAIARGLESRVCLIAESENDKIVKLLLERVAESGTE